MAIRGVKYKWVAKNPGNGWHLKYRLSSLEKSDFGLLETKSLVHSGNQVISVILRGPAAAFYDFLVVFLAKNHQKL